MEHNQSSSTIQESNLRSNHTNIYLVVGANKKEWNLEVTINGAEAWGGGGWCLQLEKLWHCQVDEEEEAWWKVCGTGRLLEASDWRPWKGFWYEIVEEDEEMERAFAFLCSSRRNLSSWATPRPLCGSFFGFLCFGALHFSTWSCTIFPFSSPFLCPLCFN